ncbi:MAG: molybdenum cofactor guanylyltransferase, partial [Chthoniobacteraceae bacterium]
MAHSAVLLAGGRSSRMGRDKPGLIFDGKPLWRHQLATLRATQPAELFISGAADGCYADAGIPVIPDDAPGLGPLGGIATALRRCTGEPLLVLAVDMPMMTPDFLRSLLDESRRTGKGVIPVVLARGLAAAPWTRQRSPNLVATLGDSIAAALYLDSQYNNTGARSQ